MAGRAIARSKAGEVRRIALAFGFVLPLVLLWWAVAQAEPMRLTPPSVESAALTRNLPQEEERRVEPAPTMSAASAAEEPVPARVEAAQPITQKKRYNVVVLGDSLGDGTWAGLYHVLQKDKRFNVVKKSRVATGFSRHDYYDWNAAAREIASETAIDIAVVVMGTNDRQPIVQDGKRHALFDAEWRNIYRQRVDDFTATLKSSGARIYWMELPVMRSPRFGADMEQFNEIFEDRAAANGITFVKTEGLATGADGGYTAYGEDRFGRTRLLRAEDGIHFTMAGYELLGKRIADAILADIASGAAIAEIKKPVEEMPVVLRSAGAVEDAANEAGQYDMADRRPGRSDDWLWLGATN
ncbi:DUF459 domain-containing protein [Parvibaculum sp.]|jgi:hypothetical protein|uniref:SGNH/GDSL hydrolase family protein n=1 Tax=Parvibaculum sp. TaxID=2024848 RepID=UPI000C3CBB77|nr:DUF459 domain-containing protein [Parvibaculum sp.]HAC60152.1 hypothetical protein [Rhodobiaceae bacterium]MAU59487.1 hypothetical protein [Parvibaculum sp.]MBO6667982.1 DUF459 domain-containing protein [Parvibaculum sp.]MBO6690595.1 DUF459 domain-containing protein [Parvibaculum sp.]MBO6714782.1 DUF459 domain-containing protein [Parvibaculum sp.]|tara:strand:- start:3138 stop:4202 length:1065 start_codon:yes stop_codon:yes gene_type:complete